MTKIIKYPDPILITPTEEFDFDNPPIDPKELTLELIRAMNQHNGVGLAANQIGYPYSIFVLKGDPENLACFNPRIVTFSGNVVSMEEACLSFPGVNVKVRRPEEIRVRFQTPSGTTTTFTYGGMTARIFQHELEHLEGKLFINNVNRYHRDKAMKGYFNG
jgi:peptide deformylase